MGSLVLNQPCQDEEIQLGIVYGSPFLVSARFLSVSGKESSFISNLQTTAFLSRNHAIGNPSDTHNCSRHLYTIIFSSLTRLTSNIHSFSIDGTHPSSGSTTLRVEADISLRVTTSWHVVVVVDPRERW
jgi:hypothetical protein